MEEIEILIGKLKGLLEEKEAELKSNSEHYNAYTRDRIENKRKEIEAFEISYQSRTTDPTQRRKIHDSFREKAIQIQRQIENIK